MIDALPTEESLRYVVGIIRAYSRSLDSGVASPPSDAEGKALAFRHMEEMWKNHPFPADYDYEQARRMAVEEKYGRFT